MNREIKFRAWDEDNKIMLHGDEDSEYWDGAKLGTVEMLNEILGGNYSCLDGELIFEQFTGLTDKNGVDIYEGDILKFDGIENLPVIHKNGAFGYNPFHYAKELDDFITFAQNSNFDWDAGKTKKLEVIGNIHENPELLNNDG